MNSVRESSSRALELTERMLGDLDILPVSARVYKAMYVCACVRTCEC